MGRILIDASNLHVGGGVQVAASLVSEWASSGARHWVEQHELTVQASTEVRAALGEPFEAPFPVVEANSSVWSWCVPLGEFDLAFTVFGPAYRRRTAAIEIAGLAIPSLGYGSCEIGLTWMENVALRLKNRLKAKVLRYSDHLVVETDHYARAIQEVLPGKLISVVPNTPSTAFRSQVQGRRSEGALILSRHPVRFAAVARDYKHKNLDFLGELGQELARQAGLIPSFEVTLTEAEFLRKSALFRYYAHNNGVVDFNGLMSLYQQSDCAILPSLQEVSSVTPWESLSAGLPTFVADIESMRTLMGDTVAYFDAHNAHIAAKQILDVLNDQSKLLHMSRAAKMGLAALPSAHDRMWAYSSIIEEALAAGIGRGSRAD